MSGRASSSHPATVTLAASYARKSDQDQEGLKSQHLGNEQKAKQDGYVIPRGIDYRFEDDETTGVSKKRAGFDRLLQVISSGEARFTRVYIKDVTRLGRWSDPRFRFFVEVLCEEHGVKLVYSESQQVVDYRGEFRPEMIGLFLKDAVDGIVASEERERLIKRVTGGMRYWVLQGFYPGALAPYGLDRWLADERTGELLERIPDGHGIRKKDCRYKLVWAEDGSAEVIRSIFSLLEAGHSLSATARELERRRVSTASGRGSWQGESVRRIARNPIYCGDLVWGRTTRDGDPVDSEEAEVGGREAIVVRDFVADPPITREQWEDVQRILDGSRTRWRHRRASAPQYLLSGLVRCAGCGAGWHGHTSTRKAKTRRRYYKHGDPPAGVELCAAENRYIRSSDIERQVLETVAHVLEDDRLQALTRQAVGERLRAASSTDHERRIADTQREIERHERAVRRLMEEAGLAESETQREIAREQAARFGRLADGLRGQLQGLTEERDQLEALANRRSALADRAGDLYALLRDGAEDDRKQVIATVVQTVEVNPDVSRAQIAVRAM